MRASIAERLASLAGSGRRCALVVRARARDEQTVRGVIEQWDPPHALVREARQRVQLVRADRVLRVVSDQREAK